ncbi:MAG: hypothetical protein ABI405_14360 [Parafilimonas sp.]
MFQSQSSEDTIPDFNADLAKRLAEAADSFRDNLTHYFVCDKKYPYDVHCTAGYEVAKDANDEAVTIKAGLIGENFIFGPYKTASQGEAEIEYDSIQLRFMRADNTEVYCETLPNDVDAIILSTSAYDKFFLPYYTRLYGAVVAAALRADAITALTATPRKSVRHGGRGKTLQSGTGGTRHIAGNSEK